MNVGTNLTRPPKSLIHVSRSHECFIEVGDLLDFDKEKKRITQEIARISGILNGISNKLNNPNFSERAPKEIVEQTKAQYQNMSEQKAVLEKSLEAF
jgi:valyl-tRNA synthetase